MRVKFRDVECFRDYTYEYSEYEREEPKEFTLWQPLSLDDIKKQEEKAKPVEKTSLVVDDYTAMFADELGLRSLKNQSSSGVEVLDLSFLDYDAVDVLDGDKNITLNFNSTTTETKSKNTTSILKPNPLNGTLFSNLKELDRVNHTAVNLLNQSNENTTSFSDNSSIMVGNVSTETTNLNVTLPGNLSPILETERMNNTLSGDNQTAVNTTLLEESDKKLRGDVFSYSVPLPPSSINNLNSTTEDNVTSLSSSTNSSPENGKLILHKTVHLKNVTMNTSKSNSSGGIIFESWENVTAHLDQLNHTSSIESFSNETVVSGNLSLSSHLVRESSSEELSEESIEELFIYLRENNTEVITTTSLKTKGHNWTYEGTHQTVPMEIPDHMLKYLGKEAPTPKPKPKTIKVNYRHRPEKGRGMKTRKRKEYKPQARSGLPFSPRGFNPAMTPRGARPSSLQPFTDEEDLINMPVVIGLPRPDFSDYELYAPGSEPQHLDLDEQEVNANEYEYVSYKDPYSSGEDIKDLSLDDTAKYYLNKYAGSSVQTYFIAAEEVEWDYGGYAKR